MSYTVAQLEAMFRRDVDDELEPYLWSQATFWQLLDEAQADFCHEVDVLAGELALAYSASDTDLDLPSYVTRIRSAQAPSEKALALYNWEEWKEAIVSDDYGQAVPATAWRTATGDEPSALITDIETAKVRMYPIPNADGSVRAQIWRTQTALVTGGNELEVTDHVYQRTIVLKAISEALLKEGEETYDPKKSERFLGKYLAGVDVARNRNKRRTRRARCTSYGGL